MTHFLFGAARSGTNAITWALNGSIQIVVKNEDSTDAFEDFMLREYSVIDSLVQEYFPRPVFFKSFHDTPRAQSLLNRYKNSRAIYSIRQPSDCIGSFVNEFGRVGAEMWMTRFISAANKRSGMLIHTCRNDPATVEFAIDRASFLLNELKVCGETVFNVAACYYLWAHSFANHINLFGDQRFLIVDYDTMASDPQAALDRICRHISIRNLSIDTERWFAGRQFGKSIKVAPRLLALCETVYQNITRGVVN